MDETPDPTASSTGASPPGTPGPPPRDGRKRRSLGRGAPLLVGGLVLAALAGAYILFFRSPGAPPAERAGLTPPKKTVLAVFPFSPAAGADGSAWFGQAVSEFLPLVLEDDPDLRVLTPERLHDLAKGKPASTAAEEEDLARRGQADYLLRGEVSGKPGAVTLNASWVEVASGHEAGRWTVEGISPENLGGKLNELYLRVRTAVRPRAESEAAGLSLASLVPIKEAPTRSYLEASVLLAKGDAAGCSGKLGDALALPDFHLARYLQALAAAQRGDPQTAVAAAASLARVSRPLPARITLLTPVILALFQSGNPRNAVAPLESFLARFPDEKYPLAWLGAIEVLLLHQPDRARGHLQQSLALDPDNPDAQRLLGQATLEAGHPVEAVPLLEAVLKRKPEDESTRLLLARALRQSGRGDESRKMTEEVLSRRPENPPAVELLGSLLLDEGRTEDARQAYDRLTASRNPVVQSEGEELLGRSYLLQGSFQEGLRRYHAAVDRAAKGGDGTAQARHLSTLAEVLASLGRNQEALTALSQIRGIEGKADPDLSMINVIVSQKQFDTARKLLEDQTARWQGRASPDLLARLRESLEGTIALEEEKFPEAVRHLQASLAAPGEEPPASEALGRAYLGAGENSRAEAVFRRIVEDPNRFVDPIRYVRALMRLGEACEKQGKKDEALKNYREALKWWGRADLSLPEIGRTREALKRLGG